MKKLVSLIVLVAFTLSSYAQVTIYHDTVSAPWPKDGLAHLLKDSMVNNTGATINITWNVHSETLLTGWSWVGACDIVQCYNYPAAGNHTFALPAGQSAQIYLDPKALVTAVDGHNYVTLKVNDGTGTDKFMTYHFYSWPNQVRDLENNNVVSIYPNPASNFIYLNIIDPKVTKINVVNIIGKRIGQYEIFPNTPNPMRVPIDNIAKGIYLLQFTDNNGKLLGVKRVTKQ